jgi:4-amino-4-deoxy-L-arabinose transferase-like glycosyltransferase
MFPPAIMALVILGLLALILMPRVWRSDLLALGLCCVVCLVFLLVSPVEPEGRYLLVVAAALLALAFAGWEAALEPLVRRGRMWRWIVPASVVAGTLFVAGASLRSFPKTPDTSIPAVVKAITDNPAWTAKRILVAPEFEGPIIAEFAVQDRHRPSYQLLRPSKLFAKEDWFGAHYVELVRSPEEMMSSLRQNPVELLVWRLQLEDPPTEHARFMREMLRNYPLSWRRVTALGATGGDPSPWAVYEFVP